MILLAIDTASTLCAACVYDSAAGVERGRSVLDLGKGHAEHLMAVVGDAMAQAAVGYPDLQRIVVSVGPGSFTGVRVGISTARGFAMALKIPAVGVNTLEAIAAETRAQLGARPVLSVLDAGRDEIYAALYDEAGVPLKEPAALSLVQARALAGEYEPALAGTAALLVAADRPEKFAIGSRLATADIGVYARLGAARHPGGEKPKPLYLRDADAKPQAGFVIAREGRP